MKKQELKKIVDRKLVHLGFSPKQIISGQKKVVDYMVQVPSDNWYSNRYDNFYKVGGTD